MGRQCQACVKEILDSEKWHYNYNARAGKLEPVRDKCVSSGDSSSGHGVVSGKPSGAP